MVNYQNSSIYKLCCKDINIKEIYIGSTTNFTRRKQHHKFRCNSENNKKNNCNVYKFIRENGGWDDWDMIEIEKYNASDKRALHTRERYYLELLGASLNKNVPIRTDEEYYEANKEKSKQYYETNKEKQKENQKQYREANKEKSKQYSKQYYETNKEKQKEKLKQYYETNKEILKEKITCECGIIYTKNNKSQHLKSKKHKNFIDNKEVIVLTSI